MAESGVDGNFQRLEEEVNRLLEVLEQLRSENAALRERATDLEAGQQDADRLRARLAEVEDEQRQTTARNEAVKSRLEQLLSRLDGADL
jgi:predicted nuclease with TOPRIM domain